MPEAVIETVRDLRRHQILAAAREIVAEQGLAGLTFGALERRLAFTRGVITYHFKNKDDIVYALLDEAVADIDRAARDAVQEAEGPEAAVHAAIGAMVQGFLTHRDATQVLVSFWGRLQVDERSREANARLYRVYREQAAGLVREGQRLGRFREEVDAEAAAAVMVGAVIGVVAQVLFEEEAIADDRVVRVAADSLAAWLVQPGELS